jgi:predicted MPP superfamily phosphohydrolase
LLISTQFADPARGVLQTPFLHNRFCGRSISGHRLITNVCGPDFAPADQVKEHGSGATRRWWGCVAAICVSVAALGGQDLTLPNRPGSLKFAVIGDNGTGDAPEYDIARQMAAFQRQFPFDQVLMLGDNLYGGETPQDFVNKFEEPYRPLLDAGVRFFAALGNHDQRSQVSYKPFSMGGQRYYTYTRASVRFFVLDSNALDPDQLAWIETALKASHDAWKICYFHHPLYSDGGRHGPAVDLRVLLEPLFIKYGVNVVFSGHDHIYERIKPQHGITYFVSGAGGQLRKGDLKRSELTAAAFDQDRSFMLVEVDGADMTFQVVSRTGTTVDSGVIHRASVP